MTTQTDVGAGGHKKLFIGVGVAAVLLLVVTAFGFFASDFINTDNQPADNVVARGINPDLLETITPDSPDGYYFGDFDGEKKIVLLKKSMVSANSLYGKENMLFIFEYGDTENGINTIIGYDIGYDDRFIFDEAKNKLLLSTVINGYIPNKNWVAEILEIDLQSGERRAVYSYELYNNIHNRSGAMNIDGYSDGWLIVNLDPCFACDGGGGTNPTVLVNTETGQIAGLGLVGDVTISGDTVSYRNFYPVEVPCEPEDYIGDLNRCELEQQNKTVYKLNDARITESLSEIVEAGSVASLNLYRSEQLGFSIRYPKRLEVCTVDAGKTFCDDEWKYFDNPTQFGVRMGSVTFGTDSSIITGGVAAVKVYDRNKISMDSLIARFMENLTNRTQYKTDLSINGVPAIMVTVTSGNYPGTVFKRVYVENGNKIYSISSADGPLDFTTFYQSFRLI